MPKAAQPKPVWNPTEIIRSALDRMAPLLLKEAFEAGYLKAKGGTTKQELKRAWEWFLKTKVPPSDMRRYKPLAKGS